MKVESMATLSAMLAMCGMAQNSGKFTCREWQEKTGRNPGAWPNLIHVHASGLCSWTPQAEILVRDHFDKTKRDWHALGVAA